MQQVVMLKDVARWLVEHRAELRLGATKHEVVAMILPVDPKDPHRREIRMRDTVEEAVAAAMTAYEAQT